MKLNSTKLRLVEKADPEMKKQIKQNDIYIILDNVLDTYNVGAVFRLADGVAARQVLLCGHTETPPNTRIKRASINTTEWVSWRHFDKTIEAIESLRNEVPNIKIIAVEQHAKSIDYTKADYGFPVAIIIGNETHGVSEDVLNECDQIVELPMFGINISLNTMVSLAIVMYKAIENNA